jgi:hypothetical protein
MVPAYIQNSAGCLSPGTYSKLEINLYPAHRVHNTMNERKGMRMKGKNRRGIAQYCSLGTCIGFCAAVGVALGAILQNIVLWMLIGASLGVVLGAIIEVNKRQK